MGKLKKAILLSFRTKVIVPVVVVMVLLMAISIWFINQRITKQLRADAAQRLNLDHLTFKHTQENRDYNLLLRYESVLAGKASSFKSLATLFDPERDREDSESTRNTIRGVLNELIGQKVANVIVLAWGNDQVVSVSQYPRFDLNAFENDCVPALNLAAQDQHKVDRVQNGERLFDIICVPIRMNDSVVGAVAFGVENSAAEEFKKSNPDGELVLLWDGQVLASTLQLIKPGVPPLLADNFKRARSPRETMEPVSEIPINDEHYLALAGVLSARGDPHELGYLILSSYEKSMQTLQDTKQDILLVSLVAILIGTAIVWFLVRKVVEPLEELRDSVEAVGQGDLNRRIEVSSMDECGELAVVFNRMTENIRYSREQLEATVETLKTTQAHLIQSEKLSGIGEFVAGVAHELNNPLTSVMGFSELLQQGDVNPQQKRHLEMVHKSAVRCQKIVQSLLSFSRRHQPERKLVCVNSLVESAVEILHYQLRTSNIEIATGLDPRLPQAMVDPHQIQQVFLNIINNARQAIEAHLPKGAIRISTDTCGKNVRVIFADNGPGIPEESLSKVFDPFFTTKEIGKGTGLGLSLCYGIVKEHGGVIKVASKPGQGATFTVELPIAAPASDTPEKIDGPTLHLPNPHEGSGKKVLVIDDEEPILQMVSEALGRCGYDVDVATDGESALQRLRQRSYDLTLCDWKMPGLNGQQIYERLRATNPAQSERMIFITGDVINERTQEFLQKQNKVCLSKPFSLLEFRNAVNKALT